MLIDSADSLHTSQVVRGAADTWVRSAILDDSANAELRRLFRAALLGPAATGSLAGIAGSVSSGALRFVVLAFACGATPPDPARAGVMGSLVPA